jgi:hypothetical protein
MIALSLAVTSGETGRGQPVGVSILAPAEPSSGSLPVPQAMSLAPLWWLYIQRSHLCRNCCAVWHNTVRVAQAGHLELLRVNSE